MKVKVRIKKMIAVKGCGFFDIDGQQELFPRDNRGNIDAEKEFTVEATPFIESKIASGELVLLSRLSDDKSDDANKDKKDKDKK